MLTRRKGVGCYVSNGYYSLCPVSTIILHIISMPPLDKNKDVIWWSNYANPSKKKRIHFFTLTQHVPLLQKQNSSNCGTKYYAILWHLLTFIHVHSHLIRHYSAGVTRRNICSIPNRGMKLVSFPKRPEWLLDPPSLIFNAYGKPRTWTLPHIRAKVNKTSSPRVTWHCGEIA